MDDLINKLREVLGDDGVLSSGEISSRACSYWDSSPLRARVLLRPRSTAEVSAVLAICHGQGAHVITHGGLTGCVNGVEVSSDQVILSLERMNAVEDIDPIGRTATVQAGAILQTVQEEVAGHGLAFPLDLGARGSCTIGGNVSTNAGGINVIRHGMMRDLVLGVEAVLADGTVISAMNQMLKNNAGYDLKQLFIGSEGTLGVVTRVVLRLRRASTSLDTALVALPDFAAVCHLLSQAQSELGDNLCAYEVMWGDYYRAVTAPGWHRPPLDRIHPFYVILESRGVDVERDSERFLALLQRELESGSVVDAVLPKSEAERTSLWNVREDFEAITIHQPTFLYDVSLPIRHMQEYIERVQTAVSQSWPEGCCQVLGHIADGNLHLFITPNAAGSQLHVDVDSCVYSPLSDYGGSVSAEHGIGREKKGWLEHSRSAAEVQLMKTLKRALDPANMLNPGVVFDL
ncbi:FAD-binding oxidoreductase [Parahaliea maris]|uniref:FAD-binding oxidoreductase n=1 Tax=Parahaliea maris TaxID=2716870 RepID=A0A5C8ZUF1_9GAMM|nr:FAD-binding oxidoreductase [Parahaliea maris]TXS92133.1 FAD-binding oxidoreductase [Parahaliea maris]